MTELGMSIEVLKVTAAIGPDADIAEAMLTIYANLQATLTEHLHFYCIVDRRRQAAVNGLGQTFDIDDAHDG